MKRFLPAIRPRPLRISRRLRAVILCALLPAATAAAQAPDPAMEQAKAILAKMTLEEKVSLCHGASTMSIGAVPRVGIADEFVMSDGPHNVREDLVRDTFQSAGRKDDTSTSLPPLTTLAATWDVAMAAKHGHTLAQETRDRGKDMILGPGVNILRTPLNGRNFEYLGEDPHLAATLAVAEIKAIQANDVAACVKHFAANNQELNRHGVSAEIDERTLREIYFPAFEAAVKEGEVLTVMSGYNRFRGEHCSHSDFLNNQVLKKQWGFKGFVVTDWGGLGSTVQGALGGTDVEMNAGRNIRFFNQPLLDAVKDGKLPESVVDDKALRVLYVMARLRKLDGQPRAKGSRNTPENQQASREIAEAGIVLLKNGGNVLPLDAKALKSVLVLGKMAIEKKCMKGGSSNGKPPYEVTPLEGLQKRLGPGVEVAYLPLSDNEKGLNLTEIPETAINTFDTEIKDAGLAVRAWRAEYFNTPSPEGSPAAAGFERKLDFNWQKAAPKPGVNADHFSARWTAKIIAPETGSYVLSVGGDGGARLSVDGKTVLENWSATGKLMAAGTVDLAAGKEYEFQVEYFDERDNAAFSLKWQLPSDRAMDPAQIKAQVAKAGAVVIFTGAGHAFESESFDRQHMKLPDGQDAAVAALLGINPKTVIVNLGGTPVEMPWIKQAPAVVQYWYSGQEGGHALAAILFGDVNPSGKLPFTFPVKLADSPAHALGNYNGKSVNHAEGIFVGYRWFDAKKIEPLFPFGYGLSYTAFDYKNVKLSSPSLEPNGQVQVSVDVTNTGKRAGAEVVQLYVRDPKPPIEKAVRELKGFAKVALQAGETKTVTLTLKARDFAWFDVPGMQWKA
ncbi:MAG TPA: glycoside hydrolase family 3 C-terminal domain-containing protein, partial [Chthoniobacterales bacterium]